MKITFEGTIEELMGFFGGIEEEKKETEKDNLSDNPSYYSILYNSECNGWTESPSFNKIYLLDKQRYCNMLLHDDGYLYLNDVYNWLGIPGTKEGEKVGWIYNKNDPKAHNIVDFGIFNPRNRDFINGYTPNALLVFNVDGCIIDKI